MGVTLPAELPGSRETWAVLGLLQKRGCLYTRGGWRDRQSWLEMKPGSGDVRFSSLSSFLGEKRSKGKWLCLRWKLV